MYGNHIHCVENTTHMCIFYAWSQKDINSLFYAELIPFQLHTQTTCVLLVFGALACLDSQIYSAIFISHFFFLNNLVFICKLEQSQQGLFQSVSICFHHYQSLILLFKAFISSYGSIFCPCSFDVSDISRSPSNCSISTKLSL